ncbi:hypothetical protein AAFF_G00307460 [Aldrovandia affinis]|uniref:Uncharacterized protein n=1 Tax=Aldrovandia affinis TaxID=143900 RepID=A0AAD7R883_9TELE|nr:hypothetical protein AAFF_G00307460 [Aldrovandia affinis]
MQPSLGCSYGPGLGERRRMEVLCGHRHPQGDPLTRIEESLTYVKQAELYYMLDLACGYCQVAISLQDQEKTTFATPIRLYQFCATSQPHSSPEVSGGVC